MIPSVLLVAALLAACTTSPTSNVAQIYTQAAGTVLVQASGTVQAVRVYGSQTAGAHALETIVAMPSNTPPPTDTPGPTDTTTPPPLYAPKEDGHYLVNVDIAPGVWRSNGTGNTCYWETTDKTGAILQNDLGLAGGTAYIASTAFEVTFERCGTWTFLQGP